jgi:hypothetical protein
MFLFLLLFLSTQRFFGAQGRGFQAKDGVVIDHGYWWRDRGAANSPGPSFV